MYIDATTVAVDGTATADADVADDAEATADESKNNAHAKHPNSP